MDKIAISVRADADQDDCLAAAEQEYISEHPELSGYDLGPRWVDENDREHVVLMVPAWACGAEIDDIEITARARAFSGEGVREHRFLVSADGYVQVWDDVAGHYTLCNALSPAAERRIRRLARR